MAIDGRVLQESFSLLVEREPALTHRFYDLLFERYPRAGAMFHRRDRADQDHMLKEALVAVLAHLDDGGWMVSTLSALGARHAAFGVTDEMYDWIEECLLETFAAVGGADWSEGLTSAWTEAYRAIAAMMKQGAMGASNLPQGQSAALA